MLSVSAQRRVFASGAVLLLVGAGLVAGVSWTAADQLVHPPRERSESTPAERGLAFSRESFVTEDGVRLAAWWMPAEASHGVVVFLHGYRASKAQSIAVAPFLHAAGYSVLAFDFRAHGESEGARSTLGMEEARDVAAALAWLSERGEREVVLFGWSMGGAAALAAARDHAVRGIVVDSAFARLDDLVGRVFTRFTGLPELPFAPVSLAIASWMADRRVDQDAPVDSAREVRFPLLLIQGLEDDIARDSDALALRDAAAGPTEMWLVPGAKHTGARVADPGGYEARVLQFLSRAFGEPAAA